MSLRSEIIGKLKGLHPEALVLVGKLIQAIDLEKKESTIHEEVGSFDLEDLTSVASTTIDNLSCSDATPVESDHAFRVMNGLFADFEAMGIKLQSADSEEAVTSSIPRQPEKHHVRWAIDSDADTPYLAAKFARESLLDPGAECVCFEVVDAGGHVTHVDLSEANTDPDLGLKAALAVLKDDDDDELQLWQVELGLCDDADDFGTHTDEYTVYVAAEGEGEALDYANKFALQNIAIVGSGWFKPIAPSVIVDPAEFTD